MKEYFSFSREKNSGYNRIVIFLTKCKKGLKMKKYLFIMLICLSSTSLIAGETENKDWLTLFRENKELNKKIIKLQDSIISLEKRITKSAKDYFVFKKENKRLKIHNDKLQLESIYLVQENNKLKNKNNNLQFALNECEKNILSMKEKETVTINDTNFSSFILNPPPFVLKNEILGIFLGDSLNNNRLNQQLQIKQIWDIKCLNPDIKHLRIFTYNNYIYVIDITFKDSSYTNYKVIEKQLKLKYGVLDEDCLTNIGLERSKFTTNIDGIEVDIDLDGNAYGDNLKLSYRHVPLGNLVDKDIEKRKTVKIKDIL